MNELLRAHFLMLVLVGGIGYWIIGDDDMGHPMYKSISENRIFSDSIEMESMDMAPRMSKSTSFSGNRGGGIMPVANADFAPGETDRKIIKNASLDLEVENTEETKVLIEKEVENLEGFVTNLNSWEVRPQNLAYNFTVRVPVEKLDTLLSNLSKLGIKKSESFSTNDITAQYADTKNQLKNLELRRERLRELLKFKTESLADVLQVDREINNVQNQIERLEATQQKRDNDVAYSTLRLTINPEVQIGDAANPNWSMGKSWKTSINELISAAQSIANKAIKLIVFAPIWGPVLVAGILIRRRVSKKGKKADKK